MRRWWTAAAVGAAAALALVGCGTPAGIDRNLTDDWPALPAAEAFTPQPGACHFGLQDVGYLSGYNPIDCAQPHRAETLHVGTLTGADAGRSSPPRAGSAGARAARVECDREVGKAIGADWHSGRLRVSVIFPSALGWGGGSRWFRCDAAEVSSLDDGNVVERSGSLRGALKPGSPLAYGCFEPKLVKDDIEEMRAIGCTAKHHAEFVGVYRFPDVSYADFRRSTARAHKGCLDLIATYAKLPKNSELQYRAGTIFYHPFEEEWTNGDRGVQCFLWLSDRALTRSVKGGGSKALPVR
ncbi:septum formation family protein [Micromonospora auratinigra]|uniref:Septum formation n=1 Tax=Micromonospora auratinigra TaxID=261654 RepID=A0A1A8Z3D1_9ACTN|nr:septum formation family protein [Micromonospora auratinigra]SBT38431.1 Septum formation [Micromonospora auratinigra]